MNPRSPLVAVLNNDPDLINMLATWFETHGMHDIEQVRAGEDRRTDDGHRVDRQCRQSDHADRRDPCIRWRQTANGRAVSPLL